MAAVKQLGKAHVDRLVELEEQMLYMKEVPDQVRFLEHRMQEISDKTDGIDALISRIDGMPVQELMMRVETLEEKAKRTTSFERGDSSTGSVAQMEERVEELDSSQKAIIQMVSDMSEDFRSALEVIRSEIADVNARVNLTMRAVGNQAPTGGVLQVNRIKILEPKPFCGARDAKALENFIFDMEQYFKATNTTTEESKITLVTMHLADDAKLWWRSRFMDIQDGRCTIDTWDKLRQELRSQFFPENVEIVARRKLRELKHTGSIRDYVKQFAGLMLDIRDMSEKDKVFCFVEGLKQWARIKLYEQRVQTLSEAYAAAERLFDLSTDTPLEQRRNQSSLGGNNKQTRSNSPRSGGGDKTGGGDRKPFQQRTPPMGRNPNQQQNNSRWGPPSCFLCRGPHRVYECPNRAALKAFQATLTANGETDGEANETASQAEEGDDNPRMGALKFMSALQKNLGEDKEVTERGLMYVETWLNQKMTRSSMVDSGATHNFITETEARRLKLRWDKESGKMKAVNSAALPIVGVAKRVPLKMGSLHGEADFVVVKMGSLHGEADFVGDGIPPRT